MRKPSKPASSTGSSAVSSGRDRGGASAISASRKRATASGEPWARSSTSPSWLRTQPVMPWAWARRKTNGRKPTPWTWPVRQIRRVSRAAASAARSAARGPGFLAAFPDILAHAGGPPDAAGTLVGNHARPDRLARCAGGAVQATLVGIDLAEHDRRAVAAGRHLAHPLAGVVRIGGEREACVVGLVFLAQAVARLRDGADAAPGGVAHLHDLVETAARHLVAA